MNKQNITDLSFCPYKILEIPELTATYDQIRKGFKNMAIIWHPDKNKAPNARDMFEKIKLASEILLSDTLRPIYDDLVKAKQ